MIAVSAAPGSVVLTRILDDGTPMRIALDPAEALKLCRLLESAAQIAQPS